MAAIGGGVTVATLGEAMDLGELPVSRAVKELIELGVVDLGAAVVEEPVVEAPVVEAVELEPSPSPSPRSTIAVEAAFDDDEPVDEVGPIVLDAVDAEPVELLDDPNSARAQLDEFAAGFGLSDTPAFESAFDAPSETGPATDGDGFADFGVDAATGSSILDEPLFGNGSSEVEPLSDFSPMRLRGRATGTPSPRPRLGARSAPRSWAAATTPPRWPASCRT